MKKQKPVCVLITFIIFVINCSAIIAFQTVPATADRTAASNAADDLNEKKKERIVKLIQQFEQLSQETQSFSLFPNRVYFSVLTAINLYSTAALLDKHNAKDADGDNSANRKPVADQYKTYLNQVVNQQKTALDGAIDAAISEQNKLILQVKESNTDDPNNARAGVPDDAKTVFDLAGVNLDSPNFGILSETANSRLYLLVYLKSFTGFAIGEVDPELAFDFYEHDPANSLDPQTRQYITSDLAEKRANFVNKLFEKEPEKAIAKLTNLKEKPMAFLTSEALASFYKKDPKKAAQFAQKILDESFAGLDTEDENILYQKMNVYLYFLSYLKDSKLLSRNNPLITKNQALKIVDLLVNFYSAQDSSESGGNEFLYVADIISDFSPEKANFLLQSSNYQIKPKKKNSSADKSEPFTYDAPVVEKPTREEDTSGDSGIALKPELSPPPPTKPEINKPAPEKISLYYNQALQMSGYNVTDAVYVTNLIKISKIFNNWGEFEKSQAILILAQSKIAKAPAANSDFVLQFNIAQAYIEAKNTPEAIKITENALGYFEYFIQGLITTSRYNRDNTDIFTDDGNELDVSLNSFYSYYLQSLVSSNASLFNSLMDENPVTALNLGNKFTRRESQFVFKYYVLDGYLKYLQAQN